MMKLEITDESHNRVDWEVRWPVVRVEIGLLIGLVVLVVPIVFSPRPGRWFWLAAVGVLGVALGAIVAATTAVREEGYLERLPDGGELRVSRVWLGVGERVKVALPFEELSHFFIETQSFERAEDSVYPMARIWARTDGNEALQLSPWGEPSTIEPLGESLSKAARCSLERL